MELLLHRLMSCCARGVFGEPGSSRGPWQVCQLVFLSPAYLSGNSMARRPRSSRAWHFVLSGVRREPDGRASARGWGYDSDGQVGRLWGLWGALGGTGHVFLSLVSGLNWPNAERIE